MRTKLKERRKKFGYTQKSFADELGISKRTYEHIEQGTRFPRVKLLNLILEKLECSSVSLFDNEVVEKRGKVTKNICRYMNDFSTDKKYTIYHISAIRKCLEIEIKERKDEGIKINNKTNKGKYEIYKRVAELCSKEFAMDITPEDVKLYKNCSRQEFSDRTGKCTWTMPEVREKLGYNPRTGKEC